MRRLSIALVLILSTLAPLPGHAGGWTARPADFPAVYVQRDVRVTMSDGVRLTVDVLRPADSSGAAVAGRFPVILTQTPYNKSVLNFRSDYLITRGYVQVIADVRGTGGSEGVWDSFGTREQLDGAELVQWAASLDRPWSNGSVGTHGTSYSAINQLFTAGHRPAGLKAAFTIVPMADAYRDITGSGGQVNTSFIPLWLGLVTSLALLPPTYAASDPVGAAHALASHIGGAINFQAGTVATATTGGDTSFDGPFYRQRSPIEVVDNVEVPTFFVGGFYDLFQRGTPMLYQRLRANGVATRLLMGPWYHITAGEGLAEAGLPTLDELELRWMDRYLRGDADDAMDDDVAPVTYMNLGEGAYKTASTWPPAPVTYSPLYLGGSSTAGLEHGTLSATPGSSPPDTMVWQPASGVCSGSVAQWTASGAGCSDSRLNAPGGLTYEYRAPARFNIAGPVAAKLYVSVANANDAFITARLEDVAPDGSVTPITAGWNLLSLRALDLSKTEMSGPHIIKPYHPFTRASALPVAGGQVYELQIEVFPTAVRIDRGHALRLSIQPSDAPHLTAPLTQAASLAGGVLSLYHDATYPSSITLPWMP